MRKKIYFFFGLVRTNNETKRNEHKYILLDDIFICFVKRNELKKFRVVFSFSFNNHKNIFQDLYMSNTHTYLGCLFRKIGQID
jgi:hypothetical protein